MVQLRVFDAFPKVERSYTTRESPPKPILLVYCFIAVFFVYLHTTNMMGNVLKQRFDVDKEVREIFPIHLSIMVNMPCTGLSIYHQDVSGDQLMVNELVHGYPLDSLDGEEWCELQGSFETNRVKGLLTIMPAITRNSHKSRTSHYINYLNFGSVTTGISPLMGTRQMFDKPTQSKYFLSLIPTSYMPYGIEIETYQYAVTQSHKEVSGGLDALPAIFFHYDFDPIKVTIFDGRMSFFAWLTRAVNILGGCYFTFKALQRLIGRKLFGKSDNRYSSGLLDPSVKN